MSTGPVWTSPAAGRAGGARRRRAICLGAALIAVGAAAIAMLLLLGRSPVVPDVVGLTRVEAEAALSGAGLTVGVVAEQPAAGPAAGSVLTQDPPAGSDIDEGAAVDLVVAAGEVTVPDVAGLTRDEAAAALAREGLMVGALAQSPSAQVAPGTVVGQDPEAGSTAPRGSTVSLVLSKLPAASVPSVLGLSRGEAESALAAAGFTLGPVEQQENANASAGTVVNQDPEAGSQVVPGSAVALVLATASTGPTKVQTPGLAGLTETQAIAALVAAGLQVGTVSFVFDDDVSAGLVATQAPAAGTSVTRASLVDVAVAKGEAAGVVPDVAGLTEPDATRTLEAGGFNVGVTRVVSGLTPGYVAGQSPAPDTKWGAGLTVTLSVSRGVTLDEKTQVPVAVGLDLDEALATLEQADLVPRLLVVQSTRAGEVVGQDPAQGSEVDPGTSVTLRVGASKRPAR